MRYLLPVLAALLMLSSQSVMAGELFDRLYGLGPNKVLFALFEQQTFGPEDVQDLDLLWDEYGFSEEEVGRVFQRYQRRHTIKMDAYQEVILWHTEQDVIPSTTTKAEFDEVAQRFHEKAAIFNGTVRLIGGFLNDEEPYRRGICRWVAPNTFAMLYVVRQAREPYLGAYFPKDGGTLVSQTLH